MEKKLLQETKELELELNDERLRYQNLLNEFSRLEERYDDIKEEMSTMVGWRGNVHSRILNCFRMLLWCSCNGCRVFQSLDIRGPTPHTAVTSLNTPSVLKSQSPKTFHTGMRWGYDDQCQGYVCCGISWWAKKANGSLCAGRPWTVIHLDDHHVKLIATPD